MSWKRRTASFAGRLAYGSGLHRLLLHGKAVVVVFHRIDDRYRRDPITLTERAFTEYCRFFARHFRVCSLNELLDRLERKEDLSRRLVITFDDGYRDNYSVAAPILESLGLRACFFVTTGFIGSDTLPWWDREQRVRSEWMTWDQVRELHARGHDIGAHTVTHVDLGASDPDTVRREVVGSKEDLESRLGTRVPLFAYPYGGPQRITNAARRCVAEAGFRCCASSHGGLIVPSTVPLRLPRIPIVRWYRFAASWGAELLRSSRSPTGR